MSSTLALLDRDHLNAMTGGDKDLALEVIDIFREQTGLWMRLMDPKAEPKCFVNPHVVFQLLEAFPSTLPNRRYHIYTLIFHLPLMWPMSG